MPPRFAVLLLRTYGSLFCLEAFLIQDFQRKTPLWGRGNPHIASSRNCTISPDFASLCHEIVMPWCKGEKNCPWISHRNSLMDVTSKWSKTLGEIFKKFWCVNRNLSLPWQRQIGQSGCLPIFCQKGNLNSVWVSYFHKLRQLALPWQEIQKNPSIKHEMHVFFCQSLCATTVEELPTALNIQVSFLIKQDEVKPDWVIHPCQSKVLFNTSLEKFWQIHHFVRSAVQVACSCHGGSTCWFLMKI